MMLQSFNGIVAYVAGRLLQGLLVLFGAVTISFILVQLTGNPAQVLAGLTVPPNQVAQLSHQLGYDRPILVQYASYILGVLHGDFGQSFRGGAPAVQLVMTALPNTLILVFTSIALAVAIAFPVAIYSVLHRDSLIDQLIRRSLIVIQGIPDYWLCLMLVILFSVSLGWLSTIGFNGPSSLILPVTALALPLASVFVRLLSASLLDVMNSDFILAVRSKGIPERTIVLRHGVRNVLVPFLTFLALQVGWLIGGTLIVETIFVWPGIGTLLLRSVQSRDLTVIQAIVVLIAVVFVLANLTIDVVILFIDPRIRQGRS